ncbi:MAG: P-II family nitrogen regulator [Firmicutes bacterium]|nr:P-II family nitrogen regulator [Bacillota bacterium]
MSQANPETTAYELLYVIVNHGLGSKVLGMAKDNGVSGGTIMLGRGTVHNRLLRLLELSDIRKEIVLMVAEQQLARETLQFIDSKLELSRPNHGIGFTMPVGAFIGTGTGNPDYAFDAEDGGVRSMHRAIFIIVDKGKGEQVMDVAKSVGARGGTIINARGSSTHETIRLLNMEIEPEKEIVLILTRSESTAGIVRAVRENLKIDEPGNGIIFVQTVSETYGILDA